MRSDNKKSVVVGIFVLIGIIILVGGILTLGAQQKVFVRSYKLKAVFDDVGGLQPGNNVWFSGVKIGTVTKINFYGDSQVEIEMNVDAETKDFIRKDSKATISSDGLIGNKIIVILGGTTQAPPIENGDRLKSVMPLDTDKMMETLQENNKNLVSITNDLKALTSKISKGEGIVGAVLTDSVLADNFRNIVANLEQTSNHTSQMSAELNQFSSNLDKEGTLLHELTNDTTIYSSFKKTAQELEETSGNASSAAENFKDASAQLTSKDNALGMLLNDREFAQYLKGTMDNMEEGSENLNENLEALQYHWLFRGAFRRKAKAEKKAAEEEKE
ncbi:MlaD family protein [Echinicola jeungdonensis]|uniref:MlaD family protein n=1 Tax=Echinicola jeungdonensis TaxID=709343 RepID=A0ABV5J640_9BACT|nr:MlaD family protein [Echinicola jeungdonensis]MDN3668037.1 MlaD family protein [Echinicola jeungdonensis]